MLSLAPLRYRLAMDPSNGPIARVASFTLPVMDRKLFHANAFLRPGLGRARKANTVYGTADGSGTHESAVVARHMAISEALERWAFCDSLGSENRATYGFDADPSSNGMAAFPGFGTGRARRAAWLEAIERHCIIGWWHGSVGSTRRQSPWNDIHAIEFLHGFDDVSVVLLVRECEPDLFVYGHAAGESFEKACNRAIVELARSELVIRRHRTLHPGPLDRGLATVTDILERRCLFFSTAAGFRAVMSRARQFVRTWQRPRVVFDGEITGPWSEFTTVWRVAIEPPTMEFLQKRDDWFFW
jgi:hypothetical protein